MLTAFDGKIAELMGVTSSVRKSSRFLIDWSKGFLERLCIVISIGLPHFSASLRTALNSLDSETKFLTGSETKFYTLGSETNFSTKDSFSSTLSEKSRVARVS